ncbi:hypothetical protein [Pelomonas sp. Root1237]|uniref:hypothetical protein n=1 Tax=Pelomonas sp. Root1237 TaxID=1736434 RepID=UPI0006F53D1E|nr:hypothetical protein [Pelomonas sp. Root1237]KQV94102.1 hypothetical protein ASC91_28065 [Pelomonas sp. Root1237]
MNTTSKTLAALLPLLAGHAMAAPDAAAQSAALAAKNMAYVSTALSAFEKNLNATAATRAAHILTVRDLAYTGHQVSINEVAVLQKTDGADVAKLYEALCDYGDKAAQASAQAAAAQAAAKAEIAASYTPLKISTEKLDSAAKTLAALSKEQTDAERAEFLVQFLKDTREETKRLLDASGEAKAAADTQLKNKVDAPATQAPIQLKKD